MSFIMSLVLPLILSPFISNPLLLLILIFTSALSSLLLICSNFGTIYGLITFLIYITGMLVLFSYMLSMFPNFAISFQSGVFFLSFPWFFFGPNFFFDPPFMEELYVTAMVGGPNISAFFFLVLALFFSLIVITVLCYKGSSPLRSR